MVTSCKKLKIFSSKLELKVTSIFCSLYEPISKKGGGDGDYRLCKPLTSLLFLQKT